MIDHTLLKPDASTRPNRAIMLRSTQISFCFGLRQSNQCQAGSATARRQRCGRMYCGRFPLGATPATVKAFETQQAMRDGATEIDMVINIGALKSADYQSCFTTTLRPSPVPPMPANAMLKVIIETALLTDEEKSSCLSIGEVGGC